MRTSDLVLLLSCLWFFSCAAPKGLHGQETEDALHNAQKICDEAQKTAKDYTYLLENLNIPERAQDSILIEEQIRLTAQWNRQKFDCKLAWEQLDSSINVLMLDWRAQQKDLQSLSDNEKKIQERILKQRARPKDSLQLMR